MAQTILYYPTINIQDGTWLRCNLNGRSRIIRDGERICKCADRVVIFPHQIVRHTNAVARLDAHAVRLFAARIIRERPFKLQRNQVPS